MATVGITTIGASSDVVGAGAPLKTVVLTMPEDGTLTGIGGWYNTLDTTADRGKFGIWDSSENLLGTSDDYAGADLGGTITQIEMDVSGSIALTNGETYRIGLLVEDSNTKYSYTTGSGATGRMTASYPTAPDPYVNIADQTRAMSAYIIYDVAASGPSITSTTDPAITGTAITTLGSGFEATQGSSTLTQEQGAVSVSLTPDSWADGSITAPSATIEDGGLKYGEQTLRVTVA